MTRAGDVFGVIVDQAKIVRVYCANASEMAHYIILLDPFQYEVMP